MKSARGMFSALLVAALLAFGLVACGGSDSTSSSSEPAETEANTETEGGGESEEGGEEAEEEGGEEEAGGATAALTKTALKGEVSTAELQKVIDRVIAPGYPAEEMPSFAQEAFSVVAQPLDPEQEKFISECLSQSSCETGHGDVTIGFADGFGGNGWRKAQRAGFAMAMSYYPDAKKFIYTDGKGDVATQISNFRSLIAQGPDVIITQADAGAAMLPAIREAKAAGIPVITDFTVIEGANYGPDGDIAYNSGVSSCEQGTQAGEGALKFGKTIAMFSGISSNPFPHEWEPCTEKAVSAGGGKITTKGWTEWTPQGETEAASQLAAKGLPESLIYDYTPTAFITAFTGNGETPPPMFVSSLDMGGYGAWQEAEKEGKAFEMEASTNKSGLTALPIWLAMQLTKGEVPADVPGEIELPTVLANAKDLKDQYQADAGPGAPIGTYLPEDILKESQSAK
jgi:ABC-type sugar transport system substrate-binding protein